MGLHVHSLSNIPKSENRDYLIYLLEYGWHEPLAQALNNNFDKMAGIAAQSRAVVIKGTELAHFENEVFSWHQINNERGDDILPALLITNAHPSYFMDNDHGYIRKSGLYRESDNVKGCRMPALNIRSARIHQNAAGRCRTSLEGRNRVMLPLPVRSGDGLWGFE